MSNRKKRCEIANFEEFSIENLRKPYTGWPDTLGPPGIEPFACVRKLMTVFSYYAIFCDTLTKNL